VNVILFGNMAFADVIKLWQLGGPSSSNSYLIKREEPTERCQGPRLRCTYKLKNAKDWKKQNKTGETPKGNKV
jgi:hypothetical protein